MIRKKTIFDILASSDYGFWFVLSGLILLTKFASLQNIQFYFLHTTVAIAASHKLNFLVILCLWPEQILQEENISMMRIIYWVMSWGCPAFSLLLISHLPVRADLSATISQYHENSSRETESRYLEPSHWCLVYIHKIPTHISIGMIHLFPFFVKKIFSILNMYFSLKFAYRFIELCQ